jgi:hypothetical protein
MNVRLCNMHGSNPFVRLERKERKQTVDQRKRWF